MREYAKSFAIGVVVLVLLIWVGFGSEIIERIRGDSVPQSIELVVALTGADTETPLVGAKVVLGTLEHRTLALDQYSLVGRRVTDRQGLARFEVALQQDVAVLVISAEGYREVRIAAPELWKSASYTDAGYQVEFALEPATPVTPDR